MVSLWTNRSFRWVWLENPRNARESLDRVWGTPFSTNHALACSHGGFPTVRHNELRDLFGELLTEVCQDVRVEPCLQLLSGEVFSYRSANTAPDARANVRARAFWTRGEDAFFDVRVFHPNAQSYVDCSPASLFSRHERCKRGEHEERIVNIERGSFTPVVLATTGACGPAADCFIKRLAGQLAEHNWQPYSTVVAWLRIRIAFALVESAILCLRGGQSPRHWPVFESREVANAEARINGDEWSRHQFAIQNWPSYLATLLFLQTCSHLWTLLHTFWAYARTRTPAHVYPAYMHAHPFPCPVDYWANLLLLFCVYLFLSLEVFSVYQLYICGTL